MIKQTEITLDIIPIYINEMYPKKEGIYHYGCVIDSIEKKYGTSIKRKNDSRNKVSIFWL